MRKLALVLLTTTSLVAPAACGARTSLVTLQVKPLPRAAGAVLIASCIPGYDAASHLAALGDVTATPRPSAEQLDCLDAKLASGCAAVSTCLGWSSEPSAGCAPGCEGNVSFRCENGSRLSFDCTTFNFVCEDGGCVAHTETACGDVQPGCEGNTAVTCLGDLGSFEACERLGLTCDENPSGQSPPTAGCVGEGSPCDASDLAFAHCEDDVIVTCAGGREHRVECSGFLDGSTCLSFSSTSLIGVGCGYGASCDDVSTTCDGDAVSLCDNGAMTEIACASIGFTTCANGVCVK